MRTEPRQNAVVTQRILSFVGLAALAVALVGCAPPEPEGRIGGESTPAKTNSTEVGTTATTGDNNPTTPASPTSR